MPNIADSIFNGTFDTLVFFKTNPSATPIEVRAIISEGRDPGNSTGSGLPRNARGNEALWVSILLKQSEVASKPDIYAQVVDGSSTYDIIASENTRMGTWRCLAKTRERGRRKDA